MFNINNLKLCKYLSHKSQFLRLHFYLIIHIDVELLTKDVAFFVIPNLNIFIKKLLVS